MKNLILAFVLVISSVSFLIAQTGAPVIFKEDTLFIIKNNIGAFSMQQRADLVANNIIQLSKLPLEEFDSITVIPSEESANIVYKDIIIASITQADATAENDSIILLANQRLLIIRQALIDDYRDTSLPKLGRDIGFFLLSLLVFFIIFSLVNRVFNYFRSNLKKLQHNIFFKNNRILRFFTFITPDTERSILLFLLRMIRFTVLGLFLYLYLPFMFSRISYTRGFGEKLFGYVLKPLQYLGNGITSYLPKLFFIIVIVVAVRYLVKALAHFAQQVKEERIHLAGFYPDWAIPTLNLMRALIVIFTLVILFPYLPGAGSDAFQGISVFVGLLLSLGSAGAISNVISGVILTYMRPFQVGDRVKINDTVGDVISKNLLVAKIKTLKNEEITIPNANLLGGGIINYTALAEKYGLILHTGVTIGYDAPWKKVHQLLIDAALLTECIEKEPIPYVLQKSLDDWYVAYELNAYTKESHKIPQIYSDLHANIQDVFNEAGVEIMSSHYMTLRDGNTTTIPSDYLSKDYQSPAFRVENPIKKIIK